MKRVRLNSSTDSTAAIPGTKVGGGASKFKLEFSEQVERLCKLGVTDRDVAVFFNVNPSTVQNWKKTHPEFFERMHRGKQEADTEIAAALYRNAEGFYYDEEVLDKTWHREYNDEGVIIKAYQTTKKVMVRKYFKPDTVAQIFFLKNRRPDQWRDVQHKYEEKITITETPIQIAKELQRRGVVTLDGIYEELPKQIENASSASSD